MRDATDVNVQRAIVHLINHRKKDLVKSEAELDLNSNQKLRDYFSDQVRNALSDSRTGSALFSSDGDQSAIQESYKLLTDPTLFIPSSQELARLLFVAMGTDARISPATLAVCIYTATVSKHPSSFLALIKIDPTEALIEKLETQNGKQVVTFEVLNDVMPTKDVKLSKAALIPPKGTVKSLDLLLLDRQVTAVAANFFAYRFLNTVRAIEPSVLTQKLYLGAQKAYNRLQFPPAGESQITPEEAIAFQQEIESVLQKPTVNIESWPKKLPLSEEARKIVADHIKSELPQEKKILIDRDFARDKLLKMTRFRGDYGVVFEVERKHFDKVVKKEEHWQTQDGKNMTRLVIEVPELQWVKR
jgi:hypothetical protein